MRIVLALFLTLSPLVHGHPASGTTSVVVVMKLASCGVCTTQLRTLDQAGLGVPVYGLTHEGPDAAARVTALTGVSTRSHKEGIQTLGLWLPDEGIAMPAVVVYDRCGDEVGRLVGRTPGLDVTEQVRGLVLRADAVANCGTAPNT